MLKVGLKRMPIAICGLALGIMALSNLFYHLSLTLFGLVFFIISCTIVLLVCVKWIVFPSMFLKELKNINTFAIFPTFPMALMLMVSIIKSEFLVDLYLLNIVWYASILLHVSFILIFISRYAFRDFKSLPNTSWFVMFVGLGVTGETSSTFKSHLGEITTVIGTICFVIILIYVVINKSWQYYNQEQFPMIIIISAPAALCLNSYVLNHTTFSVGYVSVYLVLSQSLFLFSLIFLPKIIQRGFKVSYSALTFPWVTTAGALYNVSQKVYHNETITPILSVIAYIEIIWATLVVMYVIYKYIIYLTTKNVVYG
ncbi:TDT family transporter [Mammaliicoccus stepanovicii]|uniref:Putative permease n=1 Tax=Mammaliicoccus stepanovicii TaxID=643214 RepID=A0A239Y7D6_9STAP|nr:TDT family transporter [Mammaliicoccus stepanovicii]PNZ78973.1 hypothetical protein CD111_01575 [Mammaliicoccus stepanovicii]SNV54303.1 putative permease [Mammaliicoccus stepanovicii]